MQCSKSTPIQVLQNMHSDWFKPVQTCNESWIRVMTFFYVIFIFFKSAIYQTNGVGLQGNQVNMYYSNVFKML